RQCFRLSPQFLRSAFAKLIESSVHKQTSRGRIHVFCDADDPRPVISLRSRHGGGDCFADMSEILTNSLGALVQIERHMPILSGGELPDLAANPVVSLFIV